MGNQPQAHTTVDWQSLPEGVALPAYIEFDDECYTIGDDVTRMEDVRIGYDSDIMNGVFLGGRVTIGDNVIVGQDTIVDAKVKIGDSKRTTIGVGCVFDEGAIVEEGAAIGDGVHLMRGAWIKRGATVGTIVGGAVIGEYAIVGVDAEIQGNWNKVVNGELVEVPMVPAYRVLPPGAKMIHVDDADWSLCPSPSIV